jgi:hypothetical protein
MEEIKALKPKKTKKSNSREYVNAIDFRNEIIKSKELNELTPTAIAMLMRMCNEIAKTRTYKYEQDREDCVAFAMEDVIRYWRGYNPIKSEYAFAYFTMVVMNGLKKGWKRLYPVKSINKVSLSHENIYNV